MWNLTDNWLYSLLEILPFFRVKNTTLIGNSRTVTEYKIETYPVRLPKNNLFN